MKSFISILIAATASATQFNIFPIKYNENWLDLFLSNKCWAEAEVNDNYELEIGINNSLYMHDAENTLWESEFKPNLKGGSIEYDVNVSNQKSGCVAGVYLIRSTKYGHCMPEKEYQGDDDAPNCKTIDAMQANYYGFETKANPCNGIWNGKSCDEISQCNIGMQFQGIEKYGLDAYGPNGTIIDTNYTFHVKNEFIATPAYDQLHKLRTTLSQDSQEIVLESEDCTEYLKGLSNPIDSKMGIIFSNWVNTSDYAEQFELDFGQQEEGCDQASTTISNFQVTEGGSTEDLGPQFMKGDAAPSLTDCSEPDCTECRNSYWSDEPDILYPTCVDTTVYKYTNVCKRENAQKCGSEDLCFISYPHNDPDKWLSKDKNCRPLPESYMDMDGEFKYTRECRNQLAGLCFEGCEYSCNKSWPADDKDGWKSAKNMCRCYQPDEDIEF